MRSTGKRSAITAMFVVVLSLAFGPALAQEKIDVTGTWAFEVQTDNGTGTPTLVFKQDGEKITGTYSSQMIGEAQLAGTVKGQAIEFVVAANVQGMAIELTFSGTLETKDAMKGKVSFAGMGEGTFVGKRKTGA